jgi:hypothetical protein
MPLFCSGHGGFGTLVDARMKSFFEHDLRGHNVTISTANSPKR